MAGNTPPAPRLGPETGFLPREKLQKRALHRMANALGPLLSKRRRAHAISTRNFNAADHAMGIVAEYFWMRKYVTIFLK
ncbi:hypothetical protein [Azospirillum agricola]|uniref:hypothetical protein n=1 Tax=Azospirillum agricola TaxID=1720247 RepID=UPI0011785941|nr:hypothetical protein [Azospirillum agricola]